MRTKVMIGRQVVLAGVVAAMMALVSASTASADVVSDQSGAVLIFPKIVVDTTGAFGPNTDTELQITNTSNSVISARCVLVDTTPRCIGIDGPLTACTEAGEADGDNRCSPGSRCTPQWRKANDFQFTLTKRQPISWKASDGLLSFPCGGPAQDPNSPAGCQFGSNVGSDGSPSSIPPAPDDPFFGEIKCAQVNPDDFTPTVGFSDGNGRGGDLSGKATIVSVRPVDARKYNAVALKSTGVNNGDDVLQIGGPDAEYNGCPHSLIVQHVFDGADIEYSGGRSDVVTDLTLVACSQDFLTDVTSNITLQLLVFNEFEQRFSASRPFNCWAETRLSDLGNSNRPGEADDLYSLWNVGVSGTLTGQTRIRPVSSGGRANGVLGIGEEFWLRDGGDEFSDAFQLDLSGTNELGDQIVLSPNF